MSWNTEGRWYPPNGC